jgi:hypothetical protein
MTLSSGSAAATYPTATIVVAGGAVTTVTVTSPGAAFKDTTTVLTAPAASIGGTGSGFSVPVASLATGNNNTADGYQACQAVTTGSSNVCVGANTAVDSATGSSQININNVYYQNRIVFAGIRYSAAGTPLPTCNSTYHGMFAVVSDATSPTYRGAYTSGGAVETPVYCDGSSWTTH